MNSQQNAASYALYVIIYTDNKIVTNMKVKIISYEGGDQYYDILSRVETNDPEIFAEGRKIALDSDTVYLVKKNWFNVSDETLYVSVREIGTIYNWLNGRV